MGVLQGAAVDLDDLIGYTKLQNVLAMFIKHVNEQDSAILQLKDKCEHLSSKCNDQQALADAVAGQKVMSDMLANHAGDLAQLKKREEEQDLELVSLRQGLDGTSALTKEQGAMLDAVRVVSEQLVEREGVQNGIIEDLRSAIDSCASAASLEDLEGRMLELSQGIARMREELEVLQQQPSEEEVAEPPDDPPTEEAPESDQLLKLQQRLEQLEEWLANLQATVAGDVLDRIQAVADKEDQDVHHLSRQLQDLRKLISALPGAGSSATSHRCLTCFDPRHPVQTRVVIGSDGKTYKRRPSTTAPIESADVMSQIRPKSAGSSSTRRIGRQSGTGLPPPEKVPSVRDPGFLAARPHTASGVSTNAPTSHYAPSRAASDPSFLQSEPAIAAGVIGGLNRFVADGT